MVSERVCLGTFFFPSARTLTGRAPEMEEKREERGSQARLHDEGEGHFHPLGWDGTSGSFALDNTRLHDSSIAYRIPMEAVGILHHTLHCKTRV